MTLPAMVPSKEYERAEVVGSELFDFGRDMAILLKTEKGNMPVLLSRHEAQKLFDEMWWAYYFRPTENP